VLLPLCPANTAVRTNTDATEVGALPSMPNNICASPEAHAGPRAHLIETNGLEDGSERPTNQQWERMGWSAD